MLLFVWGVGGPAGAGAKVIIDKATVTISRFHWSGVPVWAQFSLDLVIVKPPWPFTNPTSGGVSGRYKHVMTAGESVIGVANGTYGTPNAWRAVAEANGLDDPLRVRPGAVLTLPAAGELEAS